MPLGSGLTITVLLAVTPVADTVCALLLHHELDRVTWIVECVVNQVISQVCPFTLSTPVLVMALCNVTVTHHHISSLLELSQLCCFINVELL